MCVQSKAEWEGGELGGVWVGMNILFLNVSGTWLLYFSKHFYFQFRFLLNLIIIKSFFCLYNCSFLFNICFSHHLSSLEVLVLSLVLIASIKFKFSFQY